MFACFFIFFFSKTQLKNEKKNEINVCTIKKNFTQNMADHAKILVVYREKFVLWLMTVAHSINKRTWVVDVIRLARKLQTFKAVALTMATHSRIQVIYHDHTLIGWISFHYHPSSFSGLISEGGVKTPPLWHCTECWWAFSFRGWIDEEDFLFSHQNRLGDVARSPFVLASLPPLFPLVQQDIESDIVSLFLFHTHLIYSSKLHRAVEVRKCSNLHEMMCTDNLRGWSDKIDW